MSDTQQDSDLNSSGGELDCSGVVHSSDIDDVGT